MEAKFTPGPCYRDNDYVRTIAEGIAIAQVFADDGHPDSEHRQLLPMKANADLYAAAPEMYEALEKAWHDLVNVAEELTTGKNVSPPAYYLGRANDIDVLLAKARGEA